MTRVNSVAGVIKAAMQELCGGEDAYAPYPQSSKLKDGTRVWRITGTQWGVLTKKGDAIYTRRKDKIPVEFVEVTRDDLDLPLDEHRKKFDDCEYFRDWEWHVVNLGAEKIEQHLTTALNKAGHNVAVSVGRASGGSAYETSIVVRMLKDQRDFVAAGLADPTVNAAAVMMGVLLPLDASERQRVTDLVLARLNIITSKEGV